MLFGEYSSSTIRTKFREKMFFLFVLVFYSQNEQTIEEKNFDAAKTWRDFDYSRIRLFSQLLFVSYRAFHAASCGLF